MNDINQLKEKLAQAERREKNLEQRIKELSNSLSVTEIKQIQERSARLAAIVDSSDDAIISKTLKGIVTS